MSIQFRRGPRAVNEVNLTVRPGEILSLIGPSGCGKTTLLRLMAGLEVPTQGTVNLQPQVDSKQGGIAFVFQQPTLLPWRTAFENVLLPLDLMGRGTSSQRRQMAERMLNRVELTDAADRFPNELSGGMRMRVSLARALVTEPRVLLLDEPFAALDDMLRNQLGQLLLELWQQQRFTAVMVTHNVAESILLSHQIAVMRDGRLEVPVDNPLSWPRGETQRSTSEFGRFYGQISALLKGAN